MKALSASHDQTRISASNGTEEEEEEEEEEDEERCYVPGA